MKRVIRASLEPRIVREYKGEYGPSFQKDAQRSVDMFDSAVVTDGIPRWTSNNQVPPEDLMQLWRAAGKDFNYDAAVAVKDAEDSEFINRYREARKGRQPSDEELYEMESAFGKGAKVRDVITDDIVTL